MPNRSSKPTRPRDPNDLAFQVVQESTGQRQKQAKPEPPPVVLTEDGKNAAAVALGRLGGAKGGPARAASMTPEQRTAIAKKAAAARWGKKG